MGQCRSSHKTLTKIIVKKYNWLVKKRQLIPTWCTMRLGPSEITLRFLSVTIQAISIMVSLVISSPVISRSTQIMLYGLGRGCYIYEDA